MTNAPRDILALARQDAPAVTATRWDRGEPPVIPSQGSAVVIPARTAKGVASANEDTLDSRIVGRVSAAGLPTSATAILECV